MEMLIEEAHMFQMMYYMYPLVSCFTSLHFSFLQGCFIKKTNQKKRSDAFPVHQLEDILVGLCSNITSIL